MVSKRTFGSLNYPLQRLSQLHRYLSHRVGAVHLVRSGRSAVGAIPLLWII